MKKGKIFLITFLVVVLGFIGIGMVMGIIEGAKNPTVDGYVYTLKDDGTFALKRLADGEPRKEVEIPAEVKGKPVTSIESGAFEGNTVLEKVVIPSSIKVVNGFSGCTALKSVTLPKGVEKIEQGAFQNCTALTEIEIPETVTVIGSDAFSGCTSIQSFNWPVTVNRIDFDTFKGCTNLSEIVIPEGVEVVNCTFEGCTSLTELSLPSSVTDVWGFSECESLVRINYKGTMEQWESMHGSQDVNGNCVVHCTDGTISDLD